MPLFVVAMALTAAAPGPAAGLQPAPHPSPLERYVDLALERNLGLRSADLAVQRERVERRDLRAGLLPSIRFAARYSRADGGRVIDIPVGDLVNPVYGALETLPEFPSGSFPDVANRAIPFLREREQETRLELRQTLLRSELRSGVRAAGHRVTAAELELVSRAATVRMEVERAWYGLLSAEAGVAIRASALDVIDEALRTTERLRAAGEVTPDEVLRVEAERLDVLQRRIAAETDRDMGRAAFNRLLDRPLDREVETRPVGTEDVDAGFARLGITAADVLEEPERVLERLRGRALASRPELEAIDAGLDAAGAGIDAAKARWIPTLDLVVDAGIQGRGYAIDDDAGFVMASAVLSWDVWSGGARSAARERAELTRSQIVLRRADAERDIELQVQGAVDRLRLALRSRDTAMRRVEAAREAWRLTERRHQEGMVNAVTLLDTRDALTRASLALNLARHDLLDRLSVLAWAVAAQTSETSP